MLLSKYFICLSVLCRLNGFGLSIGMVFWMGLPFHFHQTPFTFTKLNGYPFHLTSLINPTHLLGSHELNFLVPRLSESTFAIIPTLNTPNPTWIFHNENLIKIASSSSSNLNKKNHEVSLLFLIKSRWNFALNWLYRVSSWFSIKRTSP